MSPGTDTKGFRIFIAAGLAVLGLVLLLEFAVDHHAQFTWLDWGTGLWFFPLFGLFGTIAVVIVAKTLAIGLKRKDTYYADD